MVINVETRELSPEVTAMVFSGRLVLGRDLNTVEHTVRQRIQQGLRKLVLDFSGLDYIDSSGVGFLAVCAGVMEREGGKLAIAGASGQVMHLLTLTHLDRVLRICPDLAAAQTALLRPSAQAQA